MQIDIQARGFTLTQALRKHVERRLRFAFARLDRGIRTVSVRVSDVNGPRGGPDKTCLLQVRLERLPDVVVEDTEADLYVAIQRAVDRAGRTVARRLGRRREHAVGKSAYGLRPGSADPAPAVSSKRS